MPTSFPAIPPTPTSDETRRELALQFAIQARAERWDVKDIVKAAQAFEGFLKGDLSISPLLRIRLPSDFTRPVKRKSKK